jgi:NAD(P)-dependent dehydrogenase (short-subunit alcohol dehydrogenase family)
MRDKIILITGATSGIGKATALNLAKRGATIVITCRNKEKGDRIQNELINLSENNNIHLLQGDLSNKNDIKELTESFKNIFPRLDILINNAGTLGLPRRTENKDGHELTIATNYFSQFLLSYYLKDWLQKSPDGRIINVSSATYRLSTIDWKDFMMKGRYKPLIAYGKSKVMIALFSFELAERLKDTGITVNCVDPGTVYTNIANTYPKLFRVIYELGEPFMKSPEKGAETIIYLATEKKLTGITGKFFKNKKAFKPTRYSADEDVRKLLWDETMNYLKLS